MDSALAVHRLHFAFTVTFHYLFPQLTMGLALLIVILKTVALTNRRRALPSGRALLGEDLRHQFRDGRGDRHPDGIPVRHQLGAVLKVRRRRDRADAGHGGSLFVLSGVDLSGAVRVWREAAQPTMHWLSAFLVFAGLLAFGILHHRHRRLDAASRSATRLAPMANHADQLLGLILNPWMLWQYLHNMIGAVVTASFVMASIGAYYLLAGRFAEYGRIFVRTGVIAGTWRPSLCYFPPATGKGG